jgi:catechol 2,3-dioxygenase-like lactoylglutathione lyase family enzyme
MTDVIRTLRANTILYCDRWQESVAFYRDVLGLDIAFANHWFVEFVLGRDHFLSVADASRSTIESCGGAGITLSWQVADVVETRAQLSEGGLSVGEIGRRWGAGVLDLFDPEGHRIELWSQPIDG